MSVRALGLLAVLLGLLLLGVAGLGAHRLGWLGTRGEGALCFVNYTLAAESRQTIEVRPLHPDAPRLRYFVYHVEADPDAREREPLYHAPHAVYFLGSKGPREPDFSPLGPGALPFDHLGSPAGTDWLIEVRSALERSGGELREVVVATFRNSDASVRRYFFDPREPQLPFGWYRMEVDPPGGGRESYRAVSRVDAAEAVDRIPRCGEGG
ncbi:MAG: hypothetical protein ACE5JG_08990 [Planctomycetota bacterium]